MTFARKRKVGNFGDTDRGQTRPDNLTSTPVFFLTASNTREREFPGADAKN
jgi:hypothetical protein